MKIVITGAGRSIGKYLAEGLFPADVIPLSHADCDVTNEEQVRTVFDRIGYMDVLINNAGVGADSLVRNMTEEQWDKVTDTNLKGVFLCSKHAILKMPRGSHIINISSIVSQVGVIGACNYAASKGGLESFTKSLARELIRDGIFVNCISLGFFNIGMGTRLSWKVKEAVLKQIPVDRFGDPKEIVQAIEFIINSKYLVGSVINLSGGFYL